MSKIVDLIATKAYAQFGSGESNFQTDFRISDFTFLNPIKAGADAESKFGQLLGWIIGLILTIAAIVAFVYLIISGFQYITSGGDPAKAQTARQGIINALIGIVVILISYLLLRYVASIVMKVG